jgi:hypothetical protein
LCHRSLTVSAAALVLNLGALAVSIEPNAAGLRGLEAHPIRAVAAVVFGVFVSAITLRVLLEANRRGYPAMRLSLATMLWGIANLPIAGLILVLLFGV